MARTCSTVCLPLGEEACPDVVADPGRFRSWLDQSFRDHPELFPKAFAQGYRLKDDRASARAGLRLRRIRLKAGGQSFSVRPSFVLPYVAGFTGDVRDPLSLRAFGVPFWAIARAFGKGHMYWCRLGLSLGRNSVAGTTVRRLQQLPKRLPADEHHQTRDGTKNYIATTVGPGCVLGCALAQTAGTEDPQAACAVFEREARDARPGYQPRTVSVDGWAPTRQARLALFPLATPLRCFLHGWLSIRSRGKLGEQFAGLPGRVWEALRAPSRRGFGRRSRRLWEWAQGQRMSAWLLEQVQKLCGRSAEYGEAYSHPGGHRTSNMLDRLTRGMSRYFEDCQHLHGSPEACERHCRAWALLHNFRPWHPAAARANDGWRSPAERLNQHRYHEDWLQNLLVSASLGGYRH